MDARICVAVDFLVELVHDFPIRIGQNFNHWLEVQYEKPGYYCKKCYRQGNSEGVYWAAAKPYDLDKIR